MTVELTKIEYRATALHRDDSGAITGESTVAGGFYAQALDKLPERVREYASEADTHNIPLEDAARRVEERKDSPE